MTGALKLNVYGKLLYVLGDVFFKFTKTQSQGSGALFAAAQNIKLPLVIPKTGPTDERSGLLIIIILPISILQR